MKNFETQIKNIKRNIPFSPPDISELEIAEVTEALRSGWITTGPRTKELERRLAEYCHTSKVVCLNSATAAEELNFRICGIGEGDEVIVPAYTYTATASAAIHCGAKVIFVDSQKDNCEMDYNGEDFQSSNHLYLTRIPGITDEKRREIITKLAKCGVNTNVHYKPLPMMTAYKAKGWDMLIMLLLRLLQIMTVRRIFLTVPQ